MTELLHRELTGPIIGAYYEVYNHTSRNLPEALYERAFMLELQQRGYAVTQQDEYRIVYKDRLIGKQRLDLFVVQEIVVENKATPRLTPLNKAQTQSYLKTVGKKVGLLCNFGSEQPQFERVFFDREVRPAVERAGDQPPADWLHPDLTYQVIGGLYEVHTVLGPGFIHRMYPNACFHELRLRGLEVAPLKRMQVKYKDHILGEIPFNHLIVDGKVMVFPLAVGDTRALHLEAIKDWLRHNNLQIGIVANFNAIRLQPVVVRA
ncbi:MAG TPA: GxxExxY protein [Anaerolineae bacterium]|nr:GxxExxY protein [Anaerolineae bacterium]